jgi:hypothetical protein
MNLKPKAPQRRVEFERTPPARFAVDREFRTDRAVELLIEYFDIDISGRSGSPAIGHGMYPNREAPCQGEAAYWNPEQSRDFVDGTVQQVLAIVTGDSFDLDASGNVFGWLLRQLIVARYDLLTCAPDAYHIAVQIRAIPHYCRCVIVKFGPCASLYVYGDMFLETGFNKALSHCRSTDERASVE